MEINFRVLNFYKGIILGKFEWLVLWVSHVIGQKNSQKPWYNRFHSKYKQDFDSACRNFIFITILCLAVSLNLNFSKLSCILSCLSIFYDKTTPTAGFAATVVVALHYSKNLVLFVHTCWTILQRSAAKGQYWTLFRRGKFDCGLKR